MITVINFSHPLNEKAEKMIRDEYGNGDAIIHKIDVQLNMTEDLPSQLRSIEAEALALVGGILADPEIDLRPNVDCIIPPGHPVAASYIARRFPTANIIVMASQGTPTQYFPVALVRP